MLHVQLQHSVVIASTDEPLDDAACGVSCHLMLGSIANDPLIVREGYIAWSGSVALVIGYDLHFSMLEDCHTGVGSAQVNANGWCACSVHFGWHLKMFGGFEVVFLALGFSDNIQSLSWSDKASIFTDLK